ncbi:hypothetical protein CCP1ISM_1620001 [Azospirillaceae bacterium]
MLASTSDLPISADLTRLWEAPPGGKVNTPFLNRLIYDLMLVVWVISEARRKVFVVEYSLRHSS